MANIVIVISSYGFGHLTRQIALKNALFDLNNNLQITFVISEIQESIFRSAILTHSGVNIERIPLTPKITMNDWKSVDIEATAEIFSRFWEWETQIRDDRTWERILHPADVVINDIESLHNPIAKKMGKTIVNISNFVWSDILQSMGLDDQANNYASWEQLADYNLKLPFSTECRSFKAYIEVGVLARTIDWNKVEEITSQTERLVVFINHTHDNFDVDLEKLSDLLIEQGYAVMLTYRNKITQREHLIIIDEEVTDIHNYVAAADLMIAKVGYGTVSEIITSGTKLLFWKRAHYSEDEVLSKAILDRELGEYLAYDISKEELIVKIRAQLSRNDEIDPISHSNREIAEKILKFVKN